MIKRGQPIADGNNPVCNQCFKKSTVVLFALKNEGCLNKRSEFILLNDNKKAPLKVR